MRTVTALLASIVLSSAPLASGALSLSAGLNFTASTRSDSGGRIVPDTMGAVGPDHIVELVNGHYAVFSKDDGTELASSTQDAFFEAAGATPAGLVPDGSSFDPRVAYDAHSGRFFAVSVDNRTGNPSDPVHPNHVLVAVSNTSDPTQGWTAFAIDTDSLDETWADFPQLAVDANGVYVSMQMYPAGAVATAPANDVLVIPKSDLLAASPTVANATLFERIPTANLAGYNPQPVTSLAGGALPVELISGSLTQFGVLQQAVVTGPVTAPSLSSGPFLQVQPRLPPPDARQPGPVPNLDTSDTRFGSAVVERDGSIWAVQSVASDTGRAAIRWFEFDAAADIVLQSGLLGDPDLDYLMPSIAVNQFDEVVIGFSASGEELFASAYAALGETVAGITTFGAPLLLQQGGGSYVAIDPQGRNRFGDYSATVVDPEDPRVFWTFQEWIPVQDQWAIQVTQLLLVPEPGTFLLLAIGLGAVSARRRRLR